MSTLWFSPVDQYCERIDAGFWAEPLNALTNGAFILAAAYAFLLWRRHDARDWASLWLIGVTVAVGIGSFLFHTLANRWTLLADVVPIAVFIYSYFLLAMRRYLKLGAVAAISATALFVIFKQFFSRLWLGFFPGVTLDGSVNYLPAPVAMLVVGIACTFMNRPKVGRALLWAAGLFALSLFFRSIDGVVCATWPMGTHFLWHGLNALVLGILLRTAIAHSPAGRTIHAEN